MNARRIGPLFVTLLILAIQVGIPLIALFDSRPARFGWQMYSIVIPPPEAWIEEASGELVAIDVHALMAEPRAEISWSASLATRLCRDRSTVAVIVTDREGTTRVPCR